MEKIKIILITLLLIAPSLLISKMVPIKHIGQKFILSSWYEFAVIMDDVVIGSKFGTKKF